jgi:hypothetical protein
MKYIKMLGLPVVAVAAVMAFVVVPAATGIAFTGALLSFV